MDGFDAPGMDAYGMLPEAYQEAAFGAAVVLDPGIPGREIVVLVELTAWQKQEAA